VTDLSDDELERYARHIVLPQVGGVGQRKLKAASIAVVGAGGIGSAVLPALAGAGVSSLTIIDDDIVDRTNLQRQPMLIACTGWGQQEDVQRAREAGFDHHLVKPVDPDAVLKLLATAPTAGR
jgi:tRNA A37 threonylcarbamoyladenosine dehydratase